jgi:hypothetical protein
MTKREVKMVRLLVGITFSVLAVSTNAQLPTAIPTRTGPPLVDSSRDPYVLSIDGWWLKVNAEGTNTEKIGWEFGKSLEALGWYMSWRRPMTRDGSIPERQLYPGNLPASAWVELQPLRVIYVRATTRKETESASFCVFYQQQAVARIDFTGEIVVQLDARRHAPTCTP